MVESLSARKSLREVVRVIQVCLWFGLLLGLVVVPRLEKSRWFGIAITVNRDLPAQLKFWLEHIQWLVMYWQQPVRLQIFSVQRWLVRMRLDNIQH